MHVIIRPAMYSRLQSKHYLLLIKSVLLVTAFLSLGIFLKPLFFDQYPDFSSYYYGAKSFAEGGNPYITSAQASGPFLYPPTALWFFIPFIFFSFALAGKIFLIVSTLCFFLSIWLLFKTLKINWLSNTGLLIVVLLLNYFPEKFSLGMGQFNNVILLLTSVFIYFYNQKRENLSGMFLSTAISFKLFPILIPAYLMLTKQWKILSSAAIALTILLTVSYVLLGSSNTIYFFEQVLPSIANSTASDYYNQSLTGFLIRSIGPNAEAQSIRIVLALTSLIFSAYVVVKRKSKNELLVMGHLITANVLLNAIAWQHHFTWMIIPFLTTFSFLRIQKASWKMYLLIGLCFALVSTNLRNPTAVPAVLQSHVFLGGVGLYVLQGYLLVKASKN